MTLAAAPNPVAPGGATALAGQLTGTNNAGRDVVLQSNPFPYTQGFVNAGNALVTDAAGNFSFPVLSVPVTTQFRVVMAQRPEVTSPIVVVGAALQVRTDAKKVRRHRHSVSVRFRGSISPQNDGGRVSIQKLRGANWVEIAHTVAKDAGASSSRYRTRVRHPSLRPVPRRGGGPGPVRHRRRPSDLHPRPPLSRPERSCDPRGRRYLARFASDNREGRKMLRFGISRGRVRGDAGVRRDGAALGAFETPPPTGVAVPASGGTRYLVYSYAPQLFIFGGFLQSLIGLDAYGDLTGDPRGGTLYRAGHGNAKAIVPLSDTGSWSRYSVGGPDSTLDQHELLTDVLGILCRRQGSPVYCDTEARFTQYARAATG